MGGVIVIDAGMSRSTGLERDAYIHDHCPGYFRNYALLYQLLIVICSPTVCFFFQREAFNENYGPRV